MRALVSDRKSPPWLKAPEWLIHLLPFPGPLLVVFLTLALDFTGYKGLPAANLERAALGGIAPSTTTLLMTCPTLATASSSVATVRTVSTSAPPVYVRTVTAHVANIATFSAPTAQRDLANADLRARMSWVTFWFVLTLATVTTIVGAGLVTIRSVPRGSSIRVFGREVDRRRLFGRLVAASLLGSVLGFFETSDSTFGFYVARQIFNVVQTDGLFVPSANILTGITNWLTICAALLVILAISAGLTPADPRASLEERAKHVSSQVWKLEILLYLSAAVLIAGLLEILSLFRSAVPFLTDESKKLAEGTTLGFAWIAGIVFSAFLVTIYLPPGVVHALRALELARQAKGTWKEQAEWLSDRGLSVTFTSQLKTFAVVLSPILTGPLGALLAQLKM